MPRAVAEGLVGVGPELLGRWRASRLLATVVATVRRGHGRCVRDGGGCHCLVRDGKKGGLLSLVMGIDELMYSTLAPDKLRRDVENTEPLPLPAGKTFKGLGARSMIAFASTVVCTALVISLMIVPQIDALWEASDAL